MNPPAAHHHDHAPGHVHTHDHGHAHDFSSAFAFGVWLNVALVAAQVVGGLIAHSLALVADAGHNFADVLGLVLAWWANRLKQSVPTATHTYGLKSASILAALANAAILLLTMGAVAWEAITRFENPPEVHGSLVIIIAAAGVVINGVSAWPFLSGRRQDINVRAAFQHLAVDAGMSLGVVVAGIAIMTTGLGWIDPAVSLLIVAAVVYGTWGLLRDSLNLALQAAPPGIDVRAVHDFLASLPDVGDVHDLHVWAMSTTETALTVHLVARAADRRDEVLEQSSTGLRERFGISHATVQIEMPKPVEMVFHVKG